MTESGIVKKVEGELVRVLFHGECRACEKCGSCLATSRPREITVMNSQALPLAPGDRIEYSVSPAKAVKAAFLLLIVPILLFFPLYYAVSALLPAAGETPPVIFGLGGVALGFGINLLRRRARRDYPEIVRVLGRQDQGGTPTLS